MGRIQRIFFRKRNLYDSKHDFKKQHPRSYSGKDRTAQFNRIFGVTPSGATKTKTKKPEQKQVKTPVSTAKAELAKKKSSSKKK